MEAPQRILVGLVAAVLAQAACVSSVTTGPQESTSDVDGGAAASPSIPPPPPAPEPGVVAPPRPGGTAPTPTPGPLRDGGTSPPGGPATTPDGRPTAPDSAAADARPVGLPGGPGPSDELYDPDRVPRFDLELPPASVAALNANPRQYVRGTFRYGGETVADVGVRLKGEATLRPLSRKAPFKIKFDEFVPDQTFRGLRRMTLNNLTEDASFLAERLSYHVFRAAGLPAPRANNALVTVNGQPYGLYANIETEDKTFLRRWFASDDGNLYEEGQVDFLPGNDARFELETNEQRNDRTDLRALITAVQGAGEGTLLTDLEASLDTAHFLRFTAAEAVVNQWDMYGYTRFYPNNFRLYHDPGRGKFVFLPWGMDMSLKDFRGRGDHIGVYTPARQFNNPAGPVTGGLIFLRCLRSVPCKAAYTAHLQEMLRLFEGWRSTRWPRATTRKSSPTCTPIPARRSATPCSNAATPPSCAPSANAPPPSARSWATSRDYSSGNAGGRAATGAVFRIVPVPVPVPVPGPVPGFSDWGPRNGRLRAGLRPSGGGIEGEGNVGDSAEGLRR